LASSSLSFERKRSLRRALPADGETSILEGCFPSTLSNAIDALDAFEALGAFPALDAFFDFASLNEHGLNEHGLDEHGWK